jgi:PAS domain S-box-containing protein
MASGYASDEPAKSNVHLLLNIFVNTTPHTGDEFLRLLVKEITAVCNVNIAAVSEFLLEANKARVVSIYSAAGPQEAVEYDLEGTPCAIAAEEGIAIFPKDVARRFPANQWLADVGAESYVAAALRSASGDVIGLIYIVHDQPLPNAPALAYLLEGLAPRVGAELERRQRENSLRRSEARLRLLTENSPDVLFYYQLLPKPSFEYISPAVERVTGYPPEAFHANPEFALQIIHEEDRPRVALALASGLTEPLTARILLRDGDTRWVELRNFAFHDQDDRTIAICGSLRDVTERLEGIEARRRSEEYRVALLQAMPDTLFRLDSAGLVLDYVSADSTAGFFEGSEDLTGGSIKDLLPRSFVAPLMQVTHAALQLERLQRIEFEVNSLGESKTYEARCIPFNDREVLLILRDFTLVKWHEGEEERRRFRDELDDKVERRRTNSYGLTYRELAILHLVAEGQADKQIAESLGISTYTVNKHVGNILGKMAAASRTEAGVRAIKEGLVG